MQPPQQNINIDLSILTPMKWGSKNWLRLIDLFLSTIEFRPSPSLGLGVRSSMAADTVKVPKSANFTLRKKPQITSSWLGFLRGSVSEPLIIL
ncbi:hypothetical protein CDAR_66211 [Caerostris darwini]|uniref:Uncharacterized protein n=1 Tax=Caerostris darwini TaxID=1538125 RepID=A0AAV4VWK9_9ARAC|nr:hypothetical protein CDAR_66211 [Caerostris darwini]